LIPQLKRDTMWGSLATVLFILFFASISVALPFSKGCYATWNQDQPLPQQITQNLGIVGILLVVPWDSVETLPGNYNWTVTSTRVEEAKSAQLVVSLNLITSPLAAPDYIKNSPQVVKINFTDTNQFHPQFCKTTQLSAFWDATFHANKIKLIQDAGKTFASNPTVVAVHASFANLRTDDWLVPHFKGTVPGCSTEVDDVKSLLLAGYKTNLVTQVGKEIITAWAQAFPSQVLKLPLGMTSKDLDNDGTQSYQAETITNWAFSQYPDRFFVQMNSLNTARVTLDQLKQENPGPNAYDYLYKILSQHPMALQMVAAAENGGKDGCRQNNGKSPCPPVQVAQQSIDIALTYYTHSLEFWTIDSSVVELRQLMLNATLVMGGNPRK